MYVDFLYWTHYLSAWHKSPEGVIKSSQIDTTCNDDAPISSPRPVYMSADAVAPVMISTNSPVMTAWRVRLKRIWYLLIMSPAFLEAFCGSKKRER